MYKIHEKEENLFIYKSTLTAFMFVCDGNNGQKTNRSQHTDLLWKRVGPYKGSAPKVYKTQGRLRIFHGSLVHWSISDKKKNIKQSLYASRTIVFAENVYTLIFIYLF